MCLVLWADDVRPLLGLEESVVWDVVGHFGGYAVSECCDLGVDVLKPGVGGPPALFFDLGVSAAVEVHGHGTSSSEGVAGDRVSGEAMVGHVEIGDGLFDGLIDVFADDLALAMAWVEVGADG